MKNQEIFTIISLITWATLILIFLSWFFYILNKRFSTKKLSERKEALKIVQFNNFMMQLKNSLDYFSMNKIGALIILKNKQDISKSFFNNGVWIDAEFSEDLLKNIFYCKKTQLHDGATIIESNYRISYVSVIFVIPKMKKPIEKFGARHNVAKVIVNQNDVIAIVVSENTGNINIFSGNETVTIKKNNHKHLEGILRKWQNEK